MEAYIQAAVKNLEGGSQVQLFVDLINPLDLAYTAIIANPPKTTQLLIRFLLICHKSLLSAASLIAQRQPEDSGAITRRALECARVALAVKLNPDNSLIWVSFEKRDQRWKQRQKGERPKNFNLKYPELKNEPLASSLDDQLGILSDAVVHFTPEFYHHLNWEEKPGPNGETMLF